MPINGYYKSFLRNNEEVRTSGYSVALNYFGNILSFIYFLTPLVQIIRAYDKSLDKEAFPLSLIFFIILNCLLWLLNAISSGDLLKWIPLLISNGFGLILNIVIIFFYLNLLLYNNMKKFFFYGAFIINVLIQITYGIFRYIILKDKENKEKEQTESEFHAIGFAATIINVLMYSSPIFNIIKIFKSKNYDFLPIFTLVVGLFCTLIFLIQGIVDYNFYDKENEVDQKQYAKETILSNGISMFFISCQIGIWIFYFSIKKDNNGINDMNERLSQNRLNESSEN